METKEREKKIEELRAEIHTLQAEEEAEREAFVEGRKKAGWKEFKFFSDYYGSHPEQGEGDISITYLFAPSIIDWKQWEGAKFAHGHWDTHLSNHDFESWLDRLEEEKDYIEL